MAVVAIHTGNIDRLPDICIKTGEPAEGARRQEFGDIPGWTLLLIFWGLIPFLIAAGFARRRLAAEIPASDQVLRRLRMVDYSAIAGLVLALGLLIATWPTQEAAFAWSGIAVAIVTLVGGALARRMLWVTGRLDGDTLWLYGVAPAFAQEAEGLAPENIEQKVSRNRWAAGILVAAVIVLGVLLFLMFDVRT
jgi:hypothetical protein